MHNFPFSPPFILSEEGEELLAVKNLEAINSVFVMSNENNSFSVTTQGNCTSEGCGEFIGQLNELSELISENDIELQVKELQNRGTQKQIQKSGYSLAGFHNFKNEILVELERVKYKNLEDMVLRMEITYDENVDILDIKNNGASTNRYTLAPAIVKLEI